MIAPASASSDLEFIFHGTGCSSALPYATCLTTSLTNPSGIACRSCRETIDGTPEGGKNTRGNTGGVIRKRTDDGKEWRNVVIDVGKTFRENSVRYFRGLGVDRIDAVVLTHGHTDAIAGLDDLRAWQSRPSPRAGQTISIYLSSRCLEAVTSQFPYLVDSAKASGGGHVPLLQWIVFDDDEALERGMMDEEGFVVPLEGVKEGLRVLPLELYHGTYFQAPPPLVRTPARTPARSGTSTPTTTHPLKIPTEMNLNSISNSNLTFDSAADAIKPSVRRLLRAVNANTNAEAETAAKITEEDTSMRFICWGFLFDGIIAYISDLDRIPEHTWKRLVNGFNGWDRTLVGDGDKYGRGNDEAEKRRKLDSETAIELSRAHAKQPHPALEPSACSTPTRAGVSTSRAPFNPASITSTSIPVPAQASAPAVDSISSSQSTISSVFGDQAPQPNSRTVVDLGSGPSSPTAVKPNLLPILIIDCLQLKPAPSHIAFMEAIHIASLLAPLRTYLVGFSHPHSHTEWTAACKEIQGTRPGGEEDGFLELVENSVQKQGVEMLQSWEWCKNHWKGYVRPAYDGMLLRVGKGRAEEVEEVK